MLAVADGSEKAKERESSESEGDSQPSEGCPSKKMTAKDHLDGVPRKQDQSAANR